MGSVSSSVFHPEKAIVRSVQILDAVFHLLIFQNAYDVLISPTETLTAREPPFPKKIRNEKKIRIKSTAEIFLISLKYNSFGKSLVFGKKQKE